MKRRHLHIIAVIIALVLSNVAMADNLKVWDTFQVDGIYYTVYNTNPLEVQVGKYGGNLAVDENTEGAITIPASVEGPDGNTYSVTSIRPYAFEGCKKIASVCFPNTIREIGDEAFARCTGLTSVNIPNSVTIIEFGAFYHCENLASIMIPNSVTKIGHRAFLGCYALKEVYSQIEEPFEIGYGREDYEGINLVTNSFEYEIATLYIPAGTKTKYEATKGWKVFMNIVEMEPEAKELAVGDTFEADGITYKVTSISPREVMVGDGEEVAFKKVIQGELIIPASVTDSDGKSYSVTSIGEVAFTECNGLTSVIVGDNVTSLGSGAFQYCENLTSVIIGNSIKSIEGYTFYACSNLASVTIGNSVESIGEEAFYHCLGMTSIEIPNSVKSIGTKAFQMCENISSVILSNALTNIGDHAFSSCFALTSVTLPNTLTTIGKWAFNGCTGLTAITSMIEEPFGIHYGCWHNVDKDKTILYVPAGTKAMYEATEGWKDFKNIVEMQTELNPIEGETTVSTEGLAGQDLSDNVVDDVYYNTGDGSYDATDGSIVISETTNMGQITNSEPGSEDVKENFRGIILRVAAGKGTITVNVKTSGNAQLVVQVGNSTPMLATKTEKGDVVVNYDVEEDTYVYIYAILGSSAARSTRASTDGEVRIYGITVSPGSSIINTYKLTYIVDGKEYKSFDVEYGTSITPEAEPSKEGYTFSGWQDLPETMPDHDVTVTGTFTINKYKLIYMVDGKEYKSFDVEYGASITPEAEPTKEGYTFSGWSDVPKTMPAKDVTVTGTFSVNKYKLTYMVDGKEYKSYNVEYGSSITPEAEPTKEGYTFSGWQDLPETMPAKDVTVTGTFSVNKYKLIYMVDDREYKSYDVEYGASITPEAEPTKEGYTFSGWSDIPQTMPPHDVSVTGTFSVNKYKLTYMVDDREYKSYDVEYGTSITPETVPAKEGYTFSGWSDIPQTMPAHDVTVTGYFEKVYDVGDIVSLVDIIMNLTTASGEDILAYDMNNDNELNIGDIILVVKEVLNGMNTRTVMASRAAADTDVDLSRFTAAQFTVSVPAGSAITDIRLTGRNQATHEVAWQQMDAGEYAVVIYSRSNLRLSPENGCIMEVVLADGNGTDITTGNVVLATPEGERLWLNSLPAYAATTGIAGLMSEASYDVYDLSGRKVRSKGDSLKGLASGVYIINGKKTIIK